MALIKCPECKKKISEHCENCPQCGYPIKNSITDNGIVNEESTTLAKVPLFKKAWFWIALGIVLAALILGTILFFGRDRGTTPKFDEDGNPVFIELTNEVYTNAEEYRGYHINIKGQVFQVMSDDGSVTGIQIWLDPDTCEQNMMIYYSTDVEVKKGDYIVCSGYIDSVTEYKNAYDAKMYAPLVISSDLKKSTYIEVMAPAKECFIFDNLKVEELGYSILLEKIEFAESETRAYIAVKNNGKSTLYVDTYGAVILQNEKQYSSTTNYEANYEEIPHGIRSGTSTSGIVVFPPISPNDFELLMDIHSENYEEKLGEYTFMIGKESSKVREPIVLLKSVNIDNVRQEKYGYTVEFEKAELYKRETRIYLTIKNNGQSTLLVDWDGVVVTQGEEKYNNTALYDIENREVPSEISKGKTISAVVVFPALKPLDFAFTLDIHTDSTKEKLGTISANISDEKAQLIASWPKDYPSAVGSYYLEEDGVKHYLTIKSDGTLYLKYVSNNPDVSYTSVVGTWTQSKDIITYSLWFEDGMEWNNPWKGKVYSNGIDFDDYFYKRN